MRHEIRIVESIDEDELRRRADRGEIAHTETSEFTFFAGSGIEDCIGSGDVVKVGESHTCPICGHRHTSFRCPACDARLHRIRAWLWVFLLVLSVVAVIAHFCSA